VGYLCKAESRISGNTLRSGPFHADPEGLVYCSDRSFSA
jgi:hypothetical protein